jgi:phage protein D/phage baseplate assembly protein gpV
MPDQENLVSQCNLKIDGQQAPDDLMTAIIEVTVEDSLHLPDMFIIRIRDDELRWVDAQTFAIGHEMEIEMGEGNRLHKVFNGEVTAVELEPTSQGTFTLLVRGYDRSHRLHRGRQSRSFVQMTDSDIAKKIAQELGLQHEVQATRQVYDYVLQDNQTNWEFLHGRAQRIGYELRVEDRKLYFQPPQGGGESAATLEWGSTLRDFHAQMSTARQVDEVIVRGWDPKAKQALIGRATRGEGAPRIGESQTGSQMAQEAFGQARVVTVDRPVTTQAEADTLAQALCDELACDFVQADGMTNGLPALRAGKTVELRNLGQRLSGTYYVTATTHTASNTQGYRTRFTVSGRRAHTLLALLSEDGSEVPRQGTVCLGIVTNNNDPDDMGRVKVKFPWLADDQESTWARVASLMAGSERGVYFLPEVNDEVLVAFDHGDMHFPYVIGVLWNGQDKPPESTSNVLDGSGRVVQRIIKSRAGHTILLDDSDGGGGITIVDKAGNKIVIDSGSNAMQLTVQGDLKIDAQGKVSIQGQAGVEINSSGNVDVKGAMVNLN